jgi:putative alpha-1,2-mannosidase
VCGSSFQYPSASALDDWFKIPGNFLLVYFDMTALTGLIYCIVVATAFANSKYIDPLIGTGGSGFGNGALNPGPQRPNAMMRLGPDTINWANVFLRWDHFGGYHYNHTYIRVFSHVIMKASSPLDTSVTGDQLIM